MDYLAFVRRPPQQTVALGLGLGWGLVFGLLLPLTPVRFWELGLQDALMRLRGPQTPPTELVLVSIDGQKTVQSQAPVQASPAQVATATQAGPDFFPDRASYARLTQRLLGAGAQVVVLNLPSGFVFPQSVGNEDLDTPLRQVVSTHGDQLVLAAYASRTYSLPDSELPIYNHFLPFTAAAQYQVPPEAVQGFVALTPDGDNTVRSTQVTGTFIRNDNLQRQSFASAAALALTKFKQAKFGQAKFGQTPFKAEPLGVRLNFWGPTGSFASIAIEAICPPVPGDQCVGPAQPELTQRVQGKIVLVGFSGGYPEAFPLQTPFGTAMPALEVEANLLATLLTDSAYQTVPASLQALITLVGALLVAGLVMSSRDKGGWQPWRGSWLSAALGLGYFGLGLVAFRQGLFVPMALPVLAWIGTGLSVALCLLLWQQRQQMQAQQRELERLQLAEREAVRYQARKLLYRVATDIHDRQLQDLKLVMDLVETLQLDHPNLEVNPILDKLERIGRGIRNELNNARNLATKLGVTPELREGLHRGIQAELQKLVDSGELSLQVIQELQPLREPPSDSAWIDAREDIFRFFRESITNVIRHAQAPHGSATQVLVSLQQKGSRCTLTIDNDGSVAVGKPSRSGYGTKVMNTIAAELPDGFWRRLPLAGGGMRTELIWTLRLDAST
ncbi:CHASE2 domain-containing protein [Leptolyngbya sp. FACHB-261]|uniref:sensor histidine kinase n=1 Tax=Leptolyngbya sp. FACHB-261 TaxID=2692806 RepID=UPI0016877209|nr:CHASE2 domain-containing protein [Leptolyngbya sp. FACHB-261]MBD2102642.1 CHASE2 domain-containing protein [Leptolyngbya sp. FACHB-261]